MKDLAISLLTRKGVYLTFQGKWIIEAVLKETSACEGRK